MHPELQRMRQLHLWLDHQIGLSTLARIEVQKQYEGISKYIEHDPSDDWDAVRTKVTNAMSVSLFQDISEDDIKALEELFKKDIDPE